MGLAMTAARHNRAAFRWWFLPSYMGLDAPCVVSTWCLATAAAASRPVSWLAVAALFLVVWTIYLVDRLVDVAQCPDWSHVSGRMNFGRRYWWLFALCAAVSTGGLLAVFIAGLPAGVMWRGALVATGMAVYFTVFVLPVVFGAKLPGKEPGVGLFFALGCYCVLDVDKQSAPMLCGVALLVTYNCLVISARDREVDRRSDAGAASQWWRTIDRDLYITGAGLSVAAAVAACLCAATWFYLALAAACLLLLGLHRRASHFSPAAVRALADYCLFTPWLVMAGRLTWLAACF